MIFDILARDLHSDCLTVYRCSARLPDPGVERDRIDHLLRRHLLDRIGDSPLHKVDRSHRAGFLASLVVLVIAHNDHVVRHNALLPPVIVIRVIHRHIVVNRKHQSMLAAGDRQFADKLDQRLSCLLGDILKVYVDPVQPVLQRLGYQSVYQLRPVGRPGKHFIRVDLSLGKVVDQTPDFQSHIVRPVHIILRRRTAEISLVVGQCKPGR